jgi:hypothetical protein
MIIKQLSVFLENKSGRLSEVSTILGDNNINMSAFNIADTSDFGILRAIVSNPEKAVSILKEADFSASLTDVICINCPNEPGAMAKALNILTKENIEIEYLYAYSVDNSANIVIRPGNIPKCIEILQNYELELVKASDLYKI